MASKYNKSTAQILIRWVLQNGLITIPKSSREEKIKENIDVFDFNILQEDMDMLDTYNENLHVPLVFNKTCLADRSKLP